MLLSSCFKSEVQIAKQRRFGSFPAQRIDGNVVIHSCMLNVNLSTWEGHACNISKNLDCLSLYSLLYRIAIAYSLRQQILGETNKSFSLVLLPVYVCIFLQHYRIHMDIGNAKNFLGIRCRLFYIKHRSPVLVTHMLIGVLA